MGQRSIPFLGAAGAPRARKQGALPKRSCASESKHMVKAEGAVASHKPVIAEKPAGRVANDGISARPGAGARRRVEQLVVAQQARPRAREREREAGNLAAATVVEDDLGRADGPPRARRRIE